MTPRDFCYWLQGYFEIAGLNEAEWQSDRVRDLVLKHLLLVNATPGKWFQELVNFVGWMESCLEFRGTAAQVEAKLSTIFEHVIDPATAGDSSQQNQIHDDEFGTPGVRC
jgi:hypothetical protein